MLFSVLKLDNRQVMQVFSDNQAIAQIEDKFEVTMVNIGMYVCTMHVERTEVPIKQLINMGVIALFK